MSWGRIEEQWKQRRWKADEPATIVDKHEEQEKYEVAKDEAKREINEYADYTFTKVGIVHALPPALNFVRLQFAKRL
jgi:hypothetical protein